MARHTDQRRRPDVVEGRRSRPAHSAEFIGQVLDPRTVPGLTLHIAATFLYIVALCRIPLSDALPCTAASCIAAVFVDHLLYYEAIAPTHVAAVVVIGFWGLYGRSSSIYTGMVQGSIVN